MDATACFSRRNKAASLIELLAVVSLAGVLMTFAAPAMRGLTGNHLTIGANVVGGVLNQARVHAITHNTPTSAYILLDRPDSPEDRFRAISAWAWDPETMVWKQISKWEKLPEGIVFSAGGNTAPALGPGEYSAFDFAALANRKSISIQSVVAEVAEVRFNHLGAATVDRSAKASAAPLRKLQIRLVPGTPHGGAVARTSEHDWIDVITDGLTGRVSYSRR